MIRPLSVRGATGTTTATRPMPNGGYGIRTRVDRPRLSIVTTNAVRNALETKGQSDRSGPIGFLVLLGIQVLLLASWYGLVFRAWWELVKGWFR